MGIPCHSSSFSNNTGGLAYDGAVGPSLTHFHSVSTTKGWGMRAVQAIRRKGGKRRRRTEGCVHPFLYILWPTLFRRPPILHSGCQQSPRYTPGAHPPPKCDLNSTRRHLPPNYSPSDLPARFAMKIQFGRVLMIWPSLDVARDLTPFSWHLHIIVLRPQHRVSKQKEMFTITDNSIRQVTSKMNKRSLICDTFCYY